MVLQQLRSERMNGERPRPGPDRAAPFPVPAPTPISGPVPAMAPYGRDRTVGI
ncbi:hypothetical protein Spla01_00943 [Streptomyces platensis]|uniref:Uncharacterized protein n=1 Tax=Streptomyces platensis TaxID=58346 RepID=A0ABX3XQT4_STRPT|nr:hypothetical protein BG653_05366 [Streptomyces platensis]